MRPQALRSLWRKDIPYVSYQPPGCLEYLRQDPIGGRQACTCDRHSKGRERHAQSLRLCMPRCEVGCSSASGTAEGLLLPTLENTSDLSCNRKDISEDLYGLVLCSGLGCRRGISGIYSSQRPDQGALAIVGGTRTVF
jgi:hypothetical protein